eukprot:jgi/Mesen1/271/ME1147617C09484
MGMGMSMGRDMGMGWEMEHDASEWDERPGRLVPPEADHNGSAAWQGPGPPSSASMRGAAGKRARMPHAAAQKCRAVLEKLRGAVAADLFLVLPRRSEDPDYFRTVARPLGVKQIEDGLERGEYASATELAADVQLMLDNA